MRGRVNSPPINNSTKPSEMNSMYVPVICVYAMLIMVLVEINEPAQIDCVEPIEQIEQCDTLNLAK